MCNFYWNPGYILQKTNILPWDFFPSFSTMAFYPRIRFPWPPKTCRPGRAWHRIRPRKAGSVPATQFTTTWQKIYRNLVSGFWVERKPGFKMIQNVQIWSMNNYHIIIIYNYHIIMQSSHPSDLHIHPTHHSAYLHLDQTWTQILGCRAKSSASKRSSKLPL